MPKCAQVAARAQRACASGSRACIESRAVAQVQSGPRAGVWSAVRAGVPPGGPARRAALVAAAAVAALYLLLLLPRLSEFGPTWDLVIADYPYGEQYLAYATSGEAAYVDFRTPPPLPHVRAPHPDFRGGRLANPDIPYPLGGMLSAASCKLLWTALGWVPAQVAHHLPAPLATAALLAVLVAVGARWRALGAGLAAALLLALSPYFLAHSAFNLKDVLETCLYTCTYLLVASALLREARTGAAVWAGVAVLFGLALAAKPNALFLPVQGLLLWAALRLLRRRAGVSGPAFPWRGVLLVLLLFPLAYLLVSPYEWIDTLARVERHWRVIVSDGTTLVTGDRLAGLKAVLRTTPLPVLAFAVVGLLDRRLERDRRTVLLVGLCVPLLRTLLPLRVHDGVRHFLEFLPMLCLWAGIGVQRVLEAVLATVRGGRAPALALPAAGLLWAAALLPGAHGVADTWPHGTCWRNALAGGLAGAQARGEPDATDTWCGSYWQGLEWLSRHADPGASVLVPVGAHVALAGAPLRLRRDLRLWRPGDPPPRAPLYVMAVTRGGLHSPFVDDVGRTGILVHELDVQGAPILRIHRVIGAAEVARLFARFEEARTDPLVAVLRALAGVEHGAPELVQALEQALATGDTVALEAALDGLRPLLSAEDRAALEELRRRVGR
jgi:hypothetical protein